jgi:hypothetical protein
MLRCFGAFEYLLDMAKMAVDAMPATPALTTTK